MENILKKKLQYVYGEIEGEKTSIKALELLEKWKKDIKDTGTDSQGSLPVSEKDTILITYGDNIKDSDEDPLQTLKRFADKYLKDKISTIHILPFSPFSSDDGFSVIDYREVNKDFGSWQQMKDLSENFGLMFDLVLNHCSAHSHWFKSYLKGEGKYSRYFIEADPDDDYSKVFRPRALPLLHAFETSRGTKHIWTTFSEDQVDLNFSNPEVFLEFLDIFMFYISQGAKIVRLDAIGFLWKEMGTSCMHHPKTHAMVQCFRAALQIVAPWVILLTETNVPHKENISYFGNGSDEAQMVYQFSLPPLTLDAFLRQDTTHLTDWAASLEKPHPDHSFFNFLASHDGVGVLPARGFLSSDEMDSMISTVLDREGLISYKSTPQGDIPYEMNISYASAITNPVLTEDEQAKQFLTSQSVILTMAGVPGIYIHSILGSKNWREGIQKTGMNRTINREKLMLNELEKELNNPKSFRHKVFTGYLDMLNERRKHKAFNPKSPQHIRTDLPKNLFMVQRGEENERIYCIHNVASELQNLSSEEITGSKKQLVSLLENKKDYSGIIEPYNVVWLKEK